MSHCDAKTQQRLLVVGYVWPEPNSSAAGTRMMQILQAFLRAGFAITYASAAIKSVHRASLESLGIAELEILLNDSSFDEAVANLNPDVVIFDRFFTEEQFGWRVSRVCPHAVQILDTEDLHSLRAARQAELKRLVKHDPTTLSVSTEASVNAEWMKDTTEAHREIAAIMRVDIALMISSVEIQLLTQYFSVPASSLFYLPLMTQIGDDAAAPSFAEREHFVSIGNFRHEPNWDAVLYLKEHIWPRIKQAIPNAQLHIYGAYPPPKATQLHNPKQGFLVKGWADDALDVIRRSRVLLAPLRFGAGVKGKLIDAWQTNTPSVTTPIGQEGLLIDDEYRHDTLPELSWPGAVCHNIDDFVEAAIALYQNQTRWEVASAHCQKMCKTLSPNAMPDLVAHVIGIQQQLGARRRDNFWGAMLRQETLQSAKYKGLWIEAKNK